MPSLMKNKFSALYPIIILTSLLIALVPLTYKIYDEYKYQHLKAYILEESSSDSLNTNKLSQFASYHGYTITYNYQNSSEIPNPTSPPPVITVENITFDNSENIIFVFAKNSNRFVSQDLIVEVNTTLLSEFVIVLIFVMLFLGIVAIISIITIYYSANKRFVIPMNKLSETLIDLKRVTVEDPTNLHEIDSVVRQLNKKVDHYLSHRNNIITIITHELKSPLNVINSAVLSRKYKIEPFDQEDEVYKVIDEQIKYMLDVIDTTLSVFEQEEYEMREFGATQHVEDVLENFKNVYAAQSIDIITEYEEELLIYGNVQIFKIVINNLLNNVAKYGTDFLKITIKDDCIIFSNHYDSNNKTGTQLGLKLSSQILKTMNLKLTHHYTKEEFIATLKKHRSNRISTKQKRI